MDSMDIWGTLLLLLAFIVGLGATWWFFYGWPRARAFSSGQHRIRVWLGLGTLVLWNPGETFIFLQNKRFKDCGSEEGGMRTVFPFRGDEARGPIPLSSGLDNWEVKPVLTREAQPLEIRVGVWWKVNDPKTYAFRIYTETSQFPAQRIPSDGRIEEAAIHNTVKHWIQVLTESAVRSQINHLGVADVVSAQATKFLQEMGEDGHDAGQLGGTFEAAISSILKNIQEKAKTYGINVENLEVQHVHLPTEIQEAINETRIAFLAPIKTEREAEAVRIKLEKLARVLGKDTVALNEIMKNFQGANFVTPINFMQSLFSSIDNKATAATASTSADVSPSTHLLGKEAEKLPGK